MAWFHRGQGRKSSEFGFRSLFVYLLRLRNHYNYKKFMNSFNPYGLRDGELSSGVRNLPTLNISFLNSVYCSISLDNNYGSKV